MADGRHIKFSNISALFDDALYFYLFKALPFASGRVWVLLVSGNENPPLE